MVPGGLAATRSPVAVSRRQHRSPSVLRAIQRAVAACACVRELHALWGSTFDTRPTGAMEHNPWSYFHAAIFAAAMRGFVAPPPAKRARAGACTTRSDAPALSVVSGWPSRPMAIPRRPQSGDNSCARAPFGCAIRPPDAPLPPLGISREWWSSGRTFGSAGTVTCSSKG